MFRKLVNLIMVRLWTSNKTDWRIFARNVMTGEWRYYSNGNWYRSDPPAALVRMDSGQ